MFELVNEYNQNAVIKVIGVGGGGGNAVMSMLESKIHGAEFILANTDSQALRDVKGATMIQIGSEITKGLGAGADPEKGRQAALEAKEEFINRFSKGKNPSEIKKVEYIFKNKSISIIDLLSDDNLGSDKLCKSKSEAKRMLSQGAVKIDGKKVLDLTYQIKNPSENTYQVGKLKYLRIKLKKG